MMVVYWCFVGAHSVLCIFQRRFSSNFVVDRLLAIALVECLARGVSSVMRTLFECRAVCCESRLGMMYLEKTKGINFSLFWLWLS